MKRTWGTRPSPGTLVRFTYGRSPHYFDSTGKRDSVNVRQGEVTMVLGDFREEFPGPRSFVVAGLRLILSMSDDIADVRIVYTWNTRPPPGTMVKFVCRRSPHYYGNGDQIEYVNVYCGDVAMVLGYSLTRNTRRPSIRLLLSCGLEVLLVCGVSSCLDLEPLA